MGISLSQRFGVLACRHRATPISRSNSRFNSRPANFFASRTESTRVERPAVTEPWVQEVVNNVIYEPWRREMRFLPASDRSL